jgi:hypothetical protein
MALKEILNDVHSLSAAAIKLGALQERDRIIGILEKELSNPLLTPREVISKIMEGTND